MTNIRLNGQSESTLLNYGRCLAKLALYFKACPTALPDDKINEHLLLLRDTQNPSFSYFKHTVYGLIIREVSKLEQRDIDMERMTIHIRQSKHKKDRIVPLSDFMKKGLVDYYQQVCPRKFVFNGKQTVSPLSVRVIQYIFRQTLQKTTIQKPANVHSLRHTYAPLLLEEGVDILTLGKEDKGPQQILNYIGRYSHKIAITNHRIVRVNQNEVCFNYKNYRKRGKKRGFTAPIGNLIMNLFDDLTFLKTCRQVFSNFGNQYTYCFDSFDYRNTF